MWKPLDDAAVDNAPAKGFIQCKCICGKEAHVRVSSLLYRETTACKSCAMRTRMAEVPQEERHRIATLASLAAAEKAKQHQDPYIVKYGAREVELVLSTLAGAKQRCTNPNNLAYLNYGLRGITFDFPSIRAGMEWVLDNLGFRAHESMSLDRIDNSKGYGPGNLRWATRSEQARNKRQYKRTQNGERIRKIMEQRSDLTYETIRLWVAKGMSDEQILQKRKYGRV